MSTDTMTPVQFKQRLKFLGLGTGAAARELGVSRFSIMHWKAGRRPVPVMARKALDGIEFHMLHSGFFE